MAKKKELSLSFFEKVQKTDGCWIWTGAKNGAGRANLRGRSAPRVAYLLMVGPIQSDDLYVCHHCDNPACVNPKHLFLATQKGNVDDMIKKGRKKILRHEDHGNRRIGWEEVREIRKCRSEGWTIRRIAKHFFVSQSQVGRIVRNEHWNEQHGRDTCQTDAAGQRG